MVCNDGRKIPSRLETVPSSELELQLSAQQSATKPQKVFSHWLTIRVSTQTKALKLNVGLICTHLLQARQPPGTLSSHMAFWTADLYSESNLADYIIQYTIHIYISYFNTPTLQFESFSICYLYYHGVLSGSIGGKSRRHTLKSAGLEPPSGRKV